MILKTVGLVLALATVASSVHVETALSPADKAAFDAISKKRFPVLMGYQNQTMHTVAVWPIDEIKVCALETQSLGEIQAQKSEELALLHRYEQDNKPVDSLIRDYLLTSRETDQLFWSAADACAAAQAAKDGHGKGKLIDIILWRAVYRDETLLKRYDEVTASYKTATQAKDRLTTLSDLQSLAALQYALVSEISGMRDLGGSPEPRRAALITRLPALEGEQADIDKGNETEVKPYLAPLVSAKQ